MGFYLNSEKSYTIYKSEVSKPYFVDKTLMLQELCPLVEQGNNHICITRPRRFGKTIMANMVSAFFSKGMDSRKLFQELKIGDTDAIRHRNQYNVIHIDLSKYSDECRSYRDYITNIKELLKEDLYKKYPDCEFRPKSSLSEDLMRIYLNTKERFLFVLDEWDAVFHMSFATQEDKESYLLFLKDLLKDHILIFSLEGLPAKDSVWQEKGILKIAATSSISTMHA